MFLRWGENHVWLNLLCDAIKKNPLCDDGSPE
jgi:hypothetical protein